MNRRRAALTTASTFLLVLSIAQTTLGSEDLSPETASKIGKAIAEVKLLESDETAERWRRASYLTSSVSSLARPGLGRSSTGVTGLGFVDQSPGWRSITDWIRVNPRDYFKVQSWQLDPRQWDIRRRQWDDLLRPSDLNVHQWNLTRQQSDDWLRLSNINLQQRESLWQSDFTLSQLRQQQWELQHETRWLDIPVPWSAALRRLPDPRVRTWEVPAARMQMPPDYQFRTGRTWLQDQFRVPEMEIQLRFWLPRYHQHMASQRKIWNSHTAGVVRGVVRDQVMSASLRRLGTLGATYGPVSNAISTVSISLDQTRSIFGTWRVTSPFRLKGTYIYRTPRVPTGLPDPRRTRGGIP